MLVFLDPVLDVGLGLRQLAGDAESLEDEFVHLRRRSAPEVLHQLGVGVQVVLEPVWPEESCLGSLWSMMWSNRVMAALIGFSQRSERTAQLGGSLSARILWCFELRYDSLSKETVMSPLPHLRSNCSSCQ